MKWIRFIDNNGRIQSGWVVDEEAARPTRAQVPEGELGSGVHDGGQLVVVKTLLAPVAPPNIFAIGLNYRDHAEESGMALPKEPLVFLKATTSVTGPGQPIRIPQSAPDEVDYEGELAIVIGKEARNVPLDAVDQFLLGYTCANDVTARDCQFKRDTQWARAKSFDTFCPLGPWVISPDAFDPRDVAVRTRVNGELLQDSRTSQFAFSAAEIVHFLSCQFTLPAGTVILTGTPPGVGFARNPARFLKDGDEVTIEIEGIGTLTNPVRSS